MVVQMMVPPCAPSREKTSAKSPGGGCDVRGGGPAGSHALVELGGGHLDLIAELLVSEEDPQRHHRDLVGGRVGGVEIGGAVAYEVDQAH